MAIVHTWQFPDIVSVLATSPDGRHMVTGCHDGRMRVHDCVTPPAYELLCETTEEKDSEMIWALAVCTSDDDERDLWVVTGHHKWMVRCWRVDAESGFRRVRLEWVGDGTREGKMKEWACSATAVCISHHRKWVAVGGHNYRGSGDAEYDICVFSLRADDDGVGARGDGDGGSSAAAPSSSSSTSSPRRVRRPTRVFVGHTHIPRSLCFSPDDRFIVSGADDRTLRVWSVASGEQLQCVPVNSKVDCIELWRGDVILTHHEDGNEWMWPPGQHTFLGESARCLSGGAHVRATCWAEDGKHVIWGGDSYDRTVRIMNLESGKQVAKLEGFVNGVIDTGVTATGNVVSSRWDSTVRLWHLDDPDVRRAIAPVRTLLVEERAALQRARDACSSSSSPTTAAVVLTLIILGHTRRITCLNT